MENPGRDAPTLQLDLHVAQGEHLVSRAAMIGDQDDFHIWRQHRNAWVRGAAFALASKPDGGRAAEEFRAAARVPKRLTDWRLGLPVEVEAARDAIETLRLWSRRPSPS